MSPKDNSSEDQENKKQKQKIIKYNRTNILQRILKLKHQKLGVWPFGHGGTCVLKEIQQN